MHFTHLSNKFKVILSSPKTNLPTPQILDEIEHIWLEEKKNRPHQLFNGQIISAHYVSSETLKTHIAEYKQFIAQQISPKLRSILHVRPVAVSGMLSCVDGLVFGQRSKYVSQNPGYWELAPSGSLEPPKCNNQHTGPKQIDFYSQICIELYEELGIDRSFVKKIKPLYLIENTENSVLDICMLIKCNLSTKELLSHYHHCANNEYDGVMIVPFKELQSFMNNNQLVDVSRLLVEQFGKHE